MSATATATEIAPVAAAPGPVRSASHPGPVALHRLSVAVADDDAVLLRVLTVARRRGYALAAVEYRRADRHRPACLELTVSGGRADRLARHLSGLVEVQAVHVA
jgi:acetolactate synthase regulatory subunit